MQTGAERPGSGERNVKYNADKLRNFTAVKVEYCADPGSFSCQLKAFGIYNPLPAFFIPYFLTRQIFVKSIWFEYARNIFFVPPI